MLRKLALSLCAIFFACAAGEAVAAAVLDRQRSSR